MTAAHHPSASAPPEPEAPDDGTPVLARGIGANSAHIAAISVRVLYSWLIVRLLGGATLGTYALAYAWIDLLSQVTVLGLDTTVMRFSARCAAEGRSGEAGRVLDRALRIVSVSASLVVGGLLAFLVARPTLDDGLRRSLVLMALAVPALAVANISVSMARGLKVMHFHLLANGIVGTVVMLAGLLIAVAAGVGANSPAVATTGATLCAALTGLALARRLLRGQRRRSPAVAGVDPAAGLLRFSWPVAGYSILNLLVFRLDLLLLGRAIGTAPGVTPLAVGVYAVAAELAGSLRKLRQIFDTAFGPVAVHAVEAGRRDTLEARLGQVLRWIALLVCPALVLVVLAGEALLGLYGPAFRVGATWLIILSVAAGAHSLLGPLETVIMVRRPQLNALNSVVAILVQLAISQVLILRYGPVGAALGVLGAYATQAALRLIELQGLQVVRFHWRPLRRPLQALSVGLVAALGLSAMPATRGLPAAAGFLLVYVASLYWLKLEPDDAELIDLLRGRRRG